MDYFGETIGLYKCLNCGHGHHDHFYLKSQISDVYKLDYAEDYLSSEKTLFQQRQIQYSLDVELLLKNLKFGAVRVLDYGCSSGGYLDAMPAEWEKSGFEVNSFHIKYLRKYKKYITVYDDLRLINDQYDVITMRGVIEHIQDHAELIEFLKRHLAPGGFLYISATPDFSSVCSALYKNQWSQVACPEHVHQFSSTSLSLLLARAGLIMRALYHPYMDTPYAEWIQDKQYFINNFIKIREDSSIEIDAMHAFAGNMMSVLYES